MRIERPTIEELEKILASEDQQVEFLPNGQVIAITKEFPDPTDEYLRDPVFDKIWNCIKSWDINVPGAYSGYCGAMGNHVRAIMDAIR
jgi:hypothetical protein